MKRNFLSGLYSLIVLAFTIVSAFASNQLLHSVPFSEKIKVKKLNPSDVPNDIKYKGTIQEAFHWTDEEGEHIFISTLTDGVNTNPDPDMAPWMQIYLYGYHYVIENGKSTLKWKVTDYVKECEFDIGVNFRKPCEITDLDNDGVAEVWMMYTLACSSDVNPSTMKIIMYEGSKKFAVRGTTKVVVALDPNGKKEYAGGNYIMDQALQHAPEVIKNYATSMWKKYMIQ